MPDQKHTGSGFHAQTEDLSVAGGHAYHHSHAGISEKNLLAAVILNFAIATAEVIGGIVANSLALLSDALHNLGDGLAVLLAYIAHRIGKKDSNPRKTFGYQRAEILAAFVNALLLVAICVFLIYEAVERFRDPAPIKGAIMFFVASIGLAANLVAVLLLHRDKQKSMNIRAAYVHLIGDTLSSVVVIIGGILIWQFEIFWLDPLLTLLISGYILKETYLLLKDSVDILMQASPKNLDLERIRQRVEQFNGVRNLHHVHVWSLNDHKVHFEGHVDLEEDMSVSQAGVLNRRISKMLHDDFQIEHTTLQMEHGCCGEDAGLIHHS